MSDKTFQLEKVLGQTNLDQAKLRRLWRFCGLGELTEKLTLEQAVLALTLDWLLDTGLTVDQAYDVSAVLQPTFTAYAADPTRFLSVQLIDGYLLACNGWDRPYDYTTGQWVEGSAEVPVTSVCLSITGLVRRALEPLTEP